MKKRWMVSLLTLGCYLLVAVLGPVAVQAEVSSPLQQPWSYYQQLNADEKHLYQQMYNKLQPGLNIYQLRQPIVFTSATTTPTQEEIEPAQNKLESTFNNAFHALCKDNPLLFWIKTGANGSSYSYSMSRIKTGDHYTWIISQLTLQVIVSEPYAANLTSYIEQVTQAVASFPVTGSNRMEKLKSIHDRLANTITYTLNAPSAHNVYGALIDGKAVCEGYAMAFKLLCDREGIPCVSVVGNGVANGTNEAHMWNYVQMEDGKWYAVDVTWDDQPSGILYEYFLCGANTYSALFGSTFSQSHVEDSRMISPYKDFSFPPLSPNRYDPSNPGRIRPPAEERGDVNGDGKVNTTDARQALQAAVNKLQLDQAAFDRADVNWDGSVNITDARLILQFAVGKLSEFV